MTYFYADFPYAGKVFRFLKTENDSSTAINEMLNRQGAIQSLDSSVITLFNFRGNYMYSVRGQAERELAYGFVTATQMPPYKTLEWTQATLE